MNKRSIAALCALGVAGSLLVSPSALAKDVQLDTRNNKEICTVTLDSAEQEIAKKLFTLKIEEQTKVQNRMRKEFPQYSSLFDAWDNHPEVQQNSPTSILTPSTSELEAKGFEALDNQYLFFTNSDKEATLKEWASNGYPYDLEVARNWSSEEMGDYPFTEKPVIFAQDGNAVTSELDTAHQLPSVYGGLQLGFYPSPRLKAMLSPGEMRLKPLEDEFEAIAGYRSLVNLLGNTKTPALLCENAYLQKESEEAAAREAAEAKRKAEEAARKAEEEKRKAEEAAKKAAEEEAARQAAEEEQRKAEEAAKKAEEEKRKAEEAAKKAAEEEAARQAAEEAEKKAAEAKRKAEEAAEKAKEEKRKAEEAAKKAAEQEAARQAAEEAEKKAAEAKRKAEEAAKKAGEEKRKAEEAKKPKPSTPDSNAKPAEEGSSTAGIVGIVLGVLALVGGAAFALLPQLRGALNLKF